MYISKYKLKKRINIKDVEYEVRTDYSVILDIFSALNDTSLTERDKAIAVLDMFYPAFAPDDESCMPMPPEHYQEAMEKFFSFVNGTNGKEEMKKCPRLVDWDKDFDIIIGAINRVLGYEIRGIEYDPKTNTGGVHWQTFISAYYEIGECLFAQIVRIRDRLAKRKSLDKNDREWYQNNRELVDMKHKYSEEDNSTLKQWGI